MDKETFDKCFENDLNKPSGLSANLHLNEQEKKNSYVTQIYLLAFRAEKKSNNMLMKHSLFGIITI